MCLELFRQLELGLCFFFFPHVAVSLTEQMMGHVIVRVHDGRFLESAHSQLELAFCFENLPPEAIGSRRRRVQPDRALQKPLRIFVFLNAGVVLSVLLVASLATSGILLASRTRPQATAKDPVPLAYRVFWSRFISGAQEPWVIFSNASFVGQPQTNMRYFNATSDSRAVILDHYTGVGEVLAVHELDRVFVLLNRHLRVKRGALFSLDDAKNNDLIFIGSPAENLTLLEIPGTQEFVFQKVDSGPRKGDVEVVNLHPGPGEPKIFLASPSNNPISEDYAVVALVPGIDPVQSMLILAGTTTMGTQAAAEYVCREDSLTELLQHLGVSQPGQLKPFEALLRVKVTKGVPVKTDLVALRKGTHS